MLWHPKSNIKPIRAARNASLWRGPGPRGIWWQMLAPRFKLSPSQRDDLAAVCEIGAAPLEKIAAKIDVQKLTISRSKIETVLRENLGPEKGAAVARVAFGIAASFRRTVSTAHEVLDRITPTIEAVSQEDSRLKAWAACRVGLERLLATQSVSLAAKALDISYDFERVYIAGRLLTSIRPVFDDPRENIMGSTIVQTLRIEFVAANGDQASISIALDADDIKQLMNECKRAINKAAKAKNEMEIKFGLDAIIPGEEQE